MYLSIQGIWGTPIGGVRFVFIYSLAECLCASSVLCIGDTKRNKALFCFILLHIQRNSLDVFEKFPGATHRKQEMDINVDGCLEVFRVLSQSGSNRAIGLG